MRTLKNAPDFRINNITFFNEDFSGGIPAGWQLADSTGSQVQWRWTITGSLNLPGSLDTNFLHTAGTTAANGYMIFDSDSAEGTGGDENSWLVSPAINATGKTNVHLTFNEFFAQYFTSEAIVLISTDGVDWTEVHRSETGIGQDETTANPNFVEIDISAFADNEATVYIAFQFIGWWDYFWMIDDVTLYEIPTNDAGVIDIWEPAAGCNFLTDSETVSITVFNYGVDDLSNFNVAYRVNGGTPVVEMITDVITSGEMYDYTFTAAGNFSAGTSNTIEAYTLLAGDADMTNDSLSVTITSGPTPLGGGGYSIGFEAGDDLTRWAVLDVNADTNTWVLNTTAPHTGLIHAGYSKNLPNNSSNDWLFSTCLELDSGTVYTLSFWYRTFSSTTNALMRVRIHTAQTANSNVVSIFALDTVRNSTWQQHVSNFSVNADGIYYMGWQAMNDPATNTSLFLDDVNLFSTVGVPQIATFERRDLAIYPNPNLGFFTIDNLKNFKGEVQVMVTDMKGRIGYREQHLNPEKLTLKLVDLPAGVYIVQVRDSQGSSSRLITIK
jgi:hypothetical protein